MGVQPAVYGDNEDRMGCRSNTMNFGYVNSRISLKCFGNIIASSFKYFINRTCLKMKRNGEHGLQNALHFGAPKMCLDLGIGHRKKHCRFTLVYWQVPSGQHTKKSGTSFSMGQYQLFLWPFSSSQTVNVYQRVLLKIIKAPPNLRWFQGPRIETVGCLAEVPRGWDWCPKVFGDWLKTSPVTSHIWRWNIPNIELMWNITGHIFTKPWNMVSTHLWFIWDDPNWRIFFGGWHRQKFLCIRTSTQNPEWSSANDVIPAHLNSKSFQISMFQIIPNHSSSQSHLNSNSKSFQIIPVLNLIWIPIPNHSKSFQFSISSEFQFQIIPVLNLIWIPIPNHSNSQSHLNSNSKSFQFSISSEFQFQIIPVLNLIWIPIPNHSSSQSHLNSNSKSFQFSISSEFQFQIIPNLNLIWIPIPNHSSSQSHLNSNSKSFQFSISSEFQFQIIPVLNLIWIPIPNHSSSQSHLNSNSKSFQISISSEFQFQIIPVLNLIWLPIPNHFKSQYHLNSNSKSFQISISSEFQFQIIPVLNLIWIPIPNHSSSQSHLNFNSKSFQISISSEFQFQIIPVLNLIWIPIPNHSKSQSHLNSNSKSFQISMFPTTKAPLRDWFSMVFPTVTHDFPHIISPWDFPMNFHSPPGYNRARVSFQDVQGNTVITWSSSFTRRGAIFVDESNLF